MILPSVGFIKAEIVSFDDLITCGSMADAKAKGKVRMEGKEYVMADGDVVEFRFNVWSGTGVVLGNFAEWFINNL